MPELLTPGVFIQEVDFGPQPIEGVSTSTAGFVGEAERGETSGDPVLVTSFADYQRKFGGFVTGMVLPYAVRGFFDNGGRRVFIMRAVGTTGNTRATRTFNNSGYNVRLVGTAVPDATAGTTTLTLSSVVGLAVGAGALTLIPIGATAGSAQQVLRVDGATGTVVLNGTGVTANARTHYARIVPAAAGASVALTTRDFGAFGGRVAALVDAHYPANVKIEAKISDTEFIVSSVTGFAIDTRVQFESKFDPTLAQARAITTIAAIDPTTRKITIADALTSALYTSGKVFVIGWRLSVSFDNASVEVLENLSATSPADFADAVAGRSAWIRVAAAPAPTLDPSAGVNGLFPTFDNGGPNTLVGGVDVAPTIDDIIGVDVQPRTGLKAIEAQQGVSIVAAPGQTDDAVISELIGQSERRMDRFAVFESQDQDDVNDVLTQRGTFNSRFGAMYHPYIKIRDPLTNQDIPLAPSGHVVGCYARTDNERGVFKAPANVTLRGITGFTKDVPDGEQDILNPAGVNVLRRFEGLGNVIWGARTISAEGLWKYVPVRRLFIFIEQSLVRGTRFAVFEPNDLRLWAHLRDAVVNFLTTQWRAGALFGAKPEEAFFVKVDETTTTEDDRQNGRVNIVVGIAPVRPAEFIVFQIGQAPQSVIIAEQG